MKHWTDKNGKIWGIDKEDSFAFQLRGVPDIDEAYAVISDATKDWVISRDGGSSFVQIDDNECFKILNDERERKSKSKLPKVPAGNARVQVR